MGTGRLSNSLFFQVITKEAEVNEWKKKYEQGKQQVEEMRLGNVLLHSVTLLSPLTSREWSCEDLTKCASLLIFSETDII